MIRSPGRSARSARDDRTESSHLQNLLSFVTREIHLLLICCLLALGPSLVTAQGRQVHGLVNDASAQPISGARIELAGAFEAARSGTDGRFVLRARAGDRVRVRRLGFLPVEFQLPDHGLNAQDPIRVIMQTAPEQLAGVFIPAGHGTPMGMSASRGTIRQVPPLGEPDVFRVLPFVPGVSQPNDLLGRVHLTGASGDETLLTLDGHPVQAPAHLTGVVGAMNVPSIDRVEVFAHHVPATTMSRAGGTIALTTRELADRFSGDVSLTLLSASATATEPDFLGGTGVLLSARRAYLREVMELVAPDRARGEPALTPSFQDGLVRLTNRIGDVVTIEALGYHTSDHREPDGIGASEPFRTSEDLGALTITARRPFWWTELRTSWDVARATDRTMTSFGRGLATSQAVRSLSALVERRVGSSSALAVSAEEIYRTSSLRWNSDGFVSSPGVPFRFDRDEQQSLRSLGLEARHRFQAPLGLRVGTRFSSAAASRWDAAPRLQLDWQQSPSLTFNIALDRRHQFDTEFSPPQVRTAASPVFLLDRPRRMDGAALGVEWRRAVGSSVLALEATGFLRRYVDRPLGIPVAFDTSVRNDIDFDRIAARSAGLATGLTWRSAGGVALQAAYTLSAARQEGVRGWHRSDWDRPHIGSMLLNVPVGRSWSVGAAYRGQSGLPVTPLEAVVLAPSPFDPDLLAPVLVLGEPNSARLGPFHRLDLMARRNWTRGRREWALTFQVVNALAIDNAIDHKWGLGGPTLVPRRPRTSTGLPLVPSIGVEVRW